MKKNEVINETKKELKPMSIMLIRIIFIIGGLFLLDINTKETFFYLIIVHCASTAKDILKFKIWIINLIKYAITISLFMYSLYISLGYGAIGLLIYILVLSLYKMFGTKKARNNYMKGVKRIESLMFGKSLDEIRKDKINKRKTLQRTESEN